MPSSAKRIAAIIATDQDDLTLRRFVMDVKNRKKSPEGIIVFLSGRDDFRDSLISDVLDETIILRCIRSSKSPAEAMTFGLRLAFAEEFDYFAVLHPRHVYRTDYFQVVESIADADLATVDAQPHCWNLINQEWLPKASDYPTPFHFRGGLGLSEEERKAGQEIGAPDTFVLNRQAARILLAGCWDHPLYKQAPYDLVWRQTLLANGVNISLVTTTKPTFVFVEQGRNQSEKVFSTEHPEPSVMQFPPGLRNSADAEITTLVHKAVDRHPDVSIVIPTYNEGDWLFHTVDSLHSLQTKFQVEIIVVDDGCTDGSVEKLKAFPDIRIVTTPQPQSGLIWAKNTGASYAIGDYLCFVDSHMLMPADWLDEMMMSRQHFPSPTLLTCSIIDVMYFGKESPLSGDQYGYTLSDWTFNVRWHHYGRNKFAEPFRVPLCPGGMSLMKRERFEELGGFCKVFRKWGSEDVEFALRHYCAGGETYSIPTTHVYHYFKNNKTRKPTFSITFAQTAFNAMFLAKTYFPTEDYEQVKTAFLHKAKLHAIIDELESGEYEDYSQSLRQKFVRGFPEWRSDFSRELLAFEAARPDLVAQPRRVGSA